MDALGEIGDRYWMIMIVVYRWLLLPMKPRGFRSCAGSCLLGWLWPTAPLSDDGFFGRAMLKSWVDWVVLRAFFKELLGGYFPQKTGLFLLGKMGL